MITCLTLFIPIFQRERERERERERKIFTEYIYNYGIIVTYIGHEKLHVQSDHLSFKWILTALFYLYIKIPMLALELVKVHWRELITWMLPSNFIEWGRLCFGTSQCLWQPSVFLFMMIMLSCYWKYITLGLSKLHSWVEIKSKSVFMMNVSVD